MRARASRGRRRLAPSGTESAQLSVAKPLALATALPVFDRGYSPLETNPLPTALRRRGLHVNMPLASTCAGAGHAGWRVSAGLVPRHTIYQYAATGGSLRGIFATQTWRPIDTASANPRPSLACGSARLP